MARHTLIVFLLISALFAGTDLTVETYILDNGLTIILNPDKYASKVFGAVVTKGVGKQYPADGIKNLFSLIKHVNLSVIWALKLIKPQMQLKHI